MIFDAYLFTFPLSPFHSVLNQNPTYRGYPHTHHHAAINPHLALKFQEANSSLTAGTSASTQTRITSCMHQTRVKRVHMKLFFYELKKGQHGASIPSRYFHRYISIRIRIIKKYIYSNTLPEPPPL